MPQQDHRQPLPLECFTQGERVTTLDGLKAGDLLLSRYATDSGPVIFNTARVTEVGKAGILMVYVNPAKPEELRNPMDRPFRVWEFMLGNGFFRAVPI